MLAPEGRHSGEKFPVSGAVPACVTGCVRRQGDHGSYHCGLVTLTEGRWLCALGVGEKVRRDGLELVLPEGSVTRGVPHDLGYLYDPADFPQPGQHQAHERQANSEVHPKSHHAGDLSRLRDAS